ncbi:AAA family ATPase [Streptomyces sp. NPDC001480]|uniref:AAA family ATPase n=1 Tax=Streptomyces sp. NPDC001480 TaxID=3364577 RepID=UPI003680653D
MTFVGRTAVIGTLDKALADCTAGGSRTVLIEGPAGCGKSALVDAVVERASAVGAVVLGAVGFPDEHDVRLGVLRQLVRGHRSLAATVATAPGAVPSRAEDMQTFCAGVRELSESAPVVLYVDDVQHADGDSLAHLQYLARHARSARVLLVLTATPHHGSGDAAFTTELMRQPTFRRIRLSRLTAANVMEAARTCGRPELADRLYTLSGGNPLLLRALLAELEELEEYEGHQGRGKDGAAGEFLPEPAGPFAQAVAACLHRGGPVAASVARAAALLGDLCSPMRAARLLGVTPAAAHPGLAGLEACGILDGGRIGHASIREAVLAELGVAERVRMHRRAAMILRAEGEPAHAAAKHLLAASGADDGTHWQATPAETDLLRTAAEELLTADDARQAVRLLELAHAACPDEERRDAVKMRLARVAWRFDPAAAEQHLQAPLAALRADRLGREHVQPLAQLLLVQGRFQDAAELYRDEDRAEAAVSPLDTMLDADTAESERLLRSAQLTEATLGPMSQALQSLIHSDRPERAVSWTRKLMEDAERRGAPGWGTVFATQHAEALLHTGDLRGAALHASRALDTLPETSSSAYRYAPAAVLVCARSAMGQYTEASRQIDQPAPAGLLGSVHGLAFLRARGLHQLTGNQPQAALADFLEVGRVMESWGIDRPAYIPWRTDAAEALLRLGRPQQAERMAVAQLALPDARRPWVRGLSLRVRGLTAASPKQRLALLGQAHEELRRSGDRVATARVLADLGQVTQTEGGAPARGSTMIRTAWNLARECGATAMCRDILPDAPVTETARSRPQQGEPRADARLSSSEQRVATLAAQGLTNREISAKLYLTVSTVEQHLTRVYRKLQISSRGDLPMDLELGSHSSARS